MSSASVTATPDSDLIDEFDLDIRISVLPDADEATAGFSTWQTCKATCISSCYCSAGSACGDSILSGQQCC